VLGERGELPILMDGHATKGQPRLFARTAIVVAALAEDWAPDNAVAAFIARAARTADDVVAWLEVINLVTDGLDNPRNLVTQDRRNGMVPFAPQEQQVAVA